MTPHIHQQVIEQVSQYRLKGSDFRLLKVIGRGAFGKVQLVRHTQPNGVYAMKLLSKDDMINRLSINNRRSTLKLHMSADGVPCPIAMNDPEPQVVAKVIRKMAEGEARRRAEMNLRFCLLLGKEVEPTRPENFEWCTCKLCVAFTTVRENVRCREALQAGERMSKALEGLQERMTEVYGCILQHFSFHRVGDAEMLRVFMHRLRYQKRMTKAPLFEEIRQFLISDCCSNFQLPPCSSLRYWPTERSCFGRTADSV